MKDLLDNLERTFDSTAGGKMTRREERWQRGLEYMARMARREYRPSIREIGTAVGAANETVQNDLLELARRGLVADCDLPEGRQMRERRAARAYVITEHGLAQASGEYPQPQLAAAGQPRDQQVVTGFDADLDTSALTSSVFGIPPGHVVIKADGDSMIDAGIDPDELVLVRLDENAENGQIALVQVDGVADDAALTLKRIYWEGDQVRLQPANPLHVPLYYSKDSVRVLGVAVEVIRRHRLR
jgi:repressor LexA